MENTHGRNNRQNKSDMERMTKRWKKLWHDTERRNKEKFLSCLNCQTSKHSYRTKLLHKKALKNWSSVFCDRTQAHLYQQQLQVDTGQQQLGEKNPNCISSSYWYCWWRQSYHARYGVDVFVQKQVLSPENKNYPRKISSKPSFWCNTGHLLCHCNCV